MLTSRFALTIVLLLGATAAHGAARDFVRLDSTAAIKGHVELGQPEWMAILADGQRIRTLVRQKDGIFSPGAAIPARTVCAIDPVSLTLCPQDKERSIRVFPGRAVPGIPGLMLEDVLPIRVLEFRERRVSRGQPKILDGEMYLASLAYDRATLLRDVEGPSSIDLARRLAAMPITRTAEATWEIPARDVRDALEQTEPDLLRSVRDWTLNPVSGSPPLTMKTPVGDARMDARGYLIQIPEIANRIGLQMGDRILDVNGTSVFSFSDLFRLYQQIKAGASRIVVLHVQRDQEEMFLTYRLR